MYFSETYMQLEKLFDKYNLEKLIKEPKQITGGLMHKMYQVIIEQKKYAVKELNPSIMQRNGVAENIINSERIAEALDGIVPVITAIQINNNPLLLYDGKHYMVFEWLDGLSIFPPDITLENCKKIGMLLGKIHTADIMVSDIHKDISGTELFDWNEYLLLGQKTGAEWTQELLQMIDDLKKWNQESIKAFLSLSSNLVLSHRDLDPKNIMWENDNPYIIDWEAAGYVNPYQELLEVLNYWANNGNGEMDKEKFESLYHSYMENVGRCQVNWETVLASGFRGMLGWLNYSLKRSLGIECSFPEEKKSGTEQVFGTIKALSQYAKQTTLFKDWLKG